jgi:hypothetical protein
VEAVVEGLSANVNTRSAAKGQRTSGTQQANETAARLLDLLQAAAVQIVVLQCEGHVTPDLTQWGFEVVARKSTKKASPAAQPA